MLYPETRPLIMGIVIGSMFEGIISGVAIGYFSKRVNSIPLGVLFGLVIGLFLAYLVAAMPNPDLSRHYYVEIMVPGGIVGMIVGVATQKFKSARAASQA